MTIGVALTSALALMMAPRRLQSLIPPAHAEAAAVSSVRLTFSVVTKKGFAGAANAPALRFNGLSECENAVCVNFNDAPANNTSTNKNHVPLLFIIPALPV